MPAKRDMKKKIMIGVLAMGVVAILAYISVSMNKNSNFQEEACDFYEMYLAACKNGYASSVDYVYFENDWEAEVYAETSNKLLNYNIGETKQINDSLYAFKVEFESAADKALDQTTAYNFVAMIGEDYKVITNPRNIPAALQENFNIDDFQKYDTGDMVFADEIL